MSGSRTSPLFPQVRQRLLAALFGHPERSFYTNELVRLAGAGSGAVQRELAALSSAGLLTVERRGNQTHYQANAAAPIFPELCGIARKTFGIADAIRDALAALPGIGQAFIFGSIAAGTPHAASDVDLFVVSDALDLESLLTALGPVEASLSRRVSPTLLTSAELATRRAAGSPFVTKVLAGPRIPLLGGPDAAA